MCRQLFSYAQSSLNVAVSNNRGFSAILITVLSVRLIDLDVVSLKFPSEYKKY